MTKGTAIVILLGAVVGAAFGIEGILRRYHSESTLAFDQVKGGSSLTTGI